MEETPNYCIKSLLYAIQETFMLTKLRDADNATQHSAIALLCPCIGCFCQLCQQYTLLYKEQLVAKPFCLQLIFNYALSCWTTIRLIIIWGEKPKSAKLSAICHEDGVRHSENAIKCQTKSQILHQVSSRRTLTEKQHLRHSPAHNDSNPLPNLRQNFRVSQVRTRPDINVALSQSGWNTQECYFSKN